MQTTCILFQRLSDQAYFRPDQVSGGILEAFMLGYALMKSANGSLVLDEPASFFHPPARTRLARLLVRAARNASIIFATHSTEMLAVAKVANVYHFSAGATGRPQQPTHLNKHFRPNPGKWFFTEERLNASAFATGMAISSFFRLN